MLNTEFHAKLESILSSQLEKHITSTHWFRKPTVISWGNRDSPEADKCEVTVVLVEKQKETIQSLLQIHGRFWKECV